MERLGTLLCDSAGANSLLAAAIKDRDTKMTKEQRIMAVRAAVFALTALAVHTNNEVALGTSWARHDAMTAITLTASVLSWVVEERSWKTG